MNIIRHRGFIAALFSLLLLAGTTGHAARAEDSIKLVSMAQQAVVETDAAGNREVKRVAAKKVVPGDEIIYRIEFENTGAEVAEHIVIRNPVPEHTRYKAGSAAGMETEISYSIDGGNHFDSPENLIVIEADGTTRPAAATEYTTIRWRYTRGLQPGEKSSVEYAVLIQ